jgi:streptogramin lyase
VSAAGRLWVLGGAAVLLAAIAFTLLRAGADDSPAPTTTRAAPTPDRTLAAGRYGGNIAGAPEVVRVARDDAVWALVRRAGHTHLVRLEGRSVREIPLGDAEPTELVPGFGRGSPYLAYAAGQTVGLLRRNGNDRGHTLVTGAARDIALDRFGHLWWTDRARSALGSWDRRRVTEIAVRGHPRPRLDEIVLQGSGSSKLWFLDDRGRIGVIDPMGGGVRLFEVETGLPSNGPSRLTASFAGAAWYTTRTGVGEFSEQAGPTEFVKSLPAPPGALTGGPDGNLWVAARRGPWLFRISPTGTVTRYTLDLPRNARMRDVARDTPRGDLWIACARPRALLKVAIPELRSKLR